MTSTPSASVIVRTFNSMSTFGAAVDSVRAQSVGCELVVVDSGSSDGTAERAADVADRVVRIPHAAFSFGGSLNAGAAVATTPVHVALSSHCVLPRSDWVERAIDHLDAGAFAACGSLVDAAGRALHAPLNAQHDYLLDHPFWGFTNHASAWRSEVWSTEPFSETLGACEDKEWSWRILKSDAGSYLTADPELFVPSAHRRRKGVRSYSDRMRNEIRAYETILGLPRYTWRDAGRDWASADPGDPFVLAGSRPFGRTRLTEVWARLSTPTGGGTR